MHMLAFNEQAAFLDNLNVRAEKHGDDTRVAADLKISLDVANDVLDQLAPGLRDALYRDALATDDPDLAEQGSIGPRKLRFPKLGALSWDVEWPGYRLGITIGAVGASDIAIADVKVDKVRIEPKEGGTVTLGMRAVIHPDGELDQLAELIQSSVDITLTPPEEKQAELAEAA